MEGRDKTGSVLLLILEKSHMPIMKTHLDFSVQDVEACYSCWYCLTRHTLHNKKIIKTKFKGGISEDKGGISEDT